MKRDRIRQALPMERVNVVGSRLRRHDRIAAKGERDADDILKKIRPLLKHALRKST
jgi:hypothetical protein